MAGVLLLGAGEFWTRNAQAQASPDAKVLAQLKQAGSNLEKLHPIEFFLYFPSSEAAERAAAKVRDSGFAAIVKRAAKGSEFLVLATKTMVPTEAELINIRKEFGALTRVEKGEYDGWGTPIVN